MARSSATGCCCFSRAVRYRRAAIFRSVAKTANRTPRTEAVTVGVEQRLGDRWALSFAWIHRRTEDLLTRRIVNLFDVQPGDPNFAQTTDGGPRINAVTYDGRID